MRDHRPVDVLPIDYVDIIFMLSVMLWLFAIYSDIEDSLNKNMLSHLWLLILIARLLLEPYLSCICSNSSNVSSRVSKSSSDVMQFTIKSII